MLPVPLAERLEPNAPAPRAGRYLLCWLRRAGRATENPVLDVALTAARALGLPLFAYQELLSDAPYASDRLHTFALEGARELQQALAERRIGFAFHLAPAGSRALESLAKDAALVVADFVPLPHVTKRDADIAAHAPLWRVDASCVVPVWRFPTPVDRSFAFRELAQAEWTRRAREPWVEVESPGPAFLPALPFEPMDWQAAELSAVVTGCDIDHGIAPVHHTPGGTAAGLARWRRFRDEKLSSYAKDRDDPVRDGTSRLSAYLNAGHLSPLQVAREAAALGGAGAEKFLDELLTWRELAWHFCWHTPAPESVDALPAWARTTLAAHESDRRVALPSWEQLARGQTGDALWDAAQRQLLTHGELHNALRMTWGKRLVEWTRTSAEALGLAFELNHRFALDGQSPTSALGILWCLGGFDRPFAPEVPVLGSVRPRPTAEHAGRIDLAEYQRRVRRSTRARPLTVAVVGAGVAGAAAARALEDAGHAVVLFDAGETPGGRLSTRREGPWRFDDGAPYFTVTDERFARYARAWWQERLVSEWTPTLSPPAGRGAGVRGGGEEKSPARLVAVPTNSALLSRLHHGLEVRFSIPVAELKRDATRWRLKDAQGDSLGEYEVVVLALPAPLAAALVDPTSYPLASRLRELPFEACWSVSLGFDTPTGVEWDWQEGVPGPLERLWRESSKPERRGEGEKWVAQSSAEWSARHVDAEPAQVTAMLLDAYWSATGAPRQTPAFSYAHLWRHARVTQPLGAPCLWDEALQLAVCGDWCLGRDVESAFLSGTAAAGRINTLRGTVEESEVERTFTTQLPLPLRGRGSG